MTGPIDVRTDEQVEADKVSLRTQLEEWKKSFMGNVNAAGAITELGN